MSQRDLARILGSISAIQISRHERSVTPPSLLTAFGYQTVFREPVASIFPGLYNAVETRIEELLGEFERELNNSNVKGRDALTIARKLEWLWERREAEDS